MRKIPIVGRELLMGKENIRKIVIDARLYGLEHAGPGRYVKNLVDTLGKIDKSNEYHILLRKKYYESVTFPDNFYKVLADYPHYTFLEQIKLPFLINKFQPDLVHFPFFNTPLLYFGKFIVTIHDLTMHRFTGGTATTRSFVKNLIWRLGYHIAFANAVYRAKMILVPSEHVKKDITDFYKINAKKIIVTYEGVAESLMKNATYDVLKKYKIRDKYFIYSGSAYPHKNLGNAITAIKLLNQKIKERVIFVITSPRGVFADRLLIQIKKLKAQEYVKYIGFLSDSELGNLIKYSLAFLYPTKSEGFGLPGLEAMQVGTLVLSSDITVLREVYQENAIYFDPNDPVSMSIAMQDVMEIGSAIRAGKISKAFKFAQKYSWEKTARQTVEVYLSLFGDR